MSREVRKRSRKVAMRNVDSEGVIELQKINCPSSSTSHSGVDDASQVEHGVPADDAKLYVCLAMQLQGRTQKEIAEHFHVTDRTIRNWCDKLKGRKIAISKDLDPHNEISLTLLRFAARETELLQWKRDAEADRDRRAMQGFAKELRQLEKDRFDFLRRLGLFTDVRFKVRPEEDSSAMQAHLLTGLLNELVPLWFLREEMGKGEE